MAVPSVDDFRERFPEFASTDDEVIELAINDASTEVDEDIWRASDYGPGVLFLAAHFLVAASQQSTFITSSGGEPAIKSESIGRLSTTYGDSVTSGSSEGMSSTEYGSRYMRLLRRNAPRILIV